MNYGAAKRAFAKIARSVIEIILMFDVLKTLVEGIVFSRLTRDKGIIFRELASGRPNARGGMLHGQRLFFLPSQKLQVLL